MVIVVLDTETTGMDNPRVVEIAAAVIPVIDGKAALDQTEYYSELCKPPVPIETGAMATHGITPEMVESSAPFKDTDIYKVLQQHNSKDCYIVGHNIAYDLSVLSNEGMALSLTQIDTLRCCRHLMPNLESHRLQYIKYHLRLDLEEDHDWMNNGRINPHSAGGDVITTYKMLVRMLVVYSLQHLAQLTASPITVTALPFGKHKGKNLRDVYLKDSGYISWLKGQDAAKDPDLAYTLKALDEELAPLLAKIKGKGTVDKNTEPNGQTTIL